MKTYTYGAKAPIVNAERVLEEIRSGHAYANEVLDIARWERVLNDNVMAPLREARDAEAPYVKGQKTKRPKLVIPDDVRATLDGLHEQRLHLQKAAYHRSSAFWCTKNERKAGVEKAISDKRKRFGMDALPRFQRFDGSGCLYVQIMAANPIRDFATDTRVRLSGEGRKRQLHLRIGTVVDAETGKKVPEWAVFPITIHREPEGRLVGVKVLRRRIGTDFKWTAHFLLDGAPGSALPAPTKKTVAIDVGWRKYRDTKAGLRVAAWVDTDGNSGELRVPENLIQRYRKTEDLRSIRDKHLNAAMDVLKAARDAATALDAPRSLVDAWNAPCDRDREGKLQSLLQATAMMHAWKGPRRLVRLALMLRDAVFGEAGPLGVHAVTLGPLTRVLEEWRRRDKHLYTWESHQRDNVLLARREMYRIFAKQMAAYDTIIFEDFDLRDVAERPESDENAEPETAQMQLARGYRFKANISSLRNAIIDAASRSGATVFKTPAAMTTQHCANCDVVEKFDAAPDVNHVCSSCGSKWDQDFNAARNMLREVAGGSFTDITPKRRDASTPTETAQRRSAGLAKARAKKKAT